MCVGTCVCIWPEEEAQGARWWGSEGGVGSEWGGAKQGEGKELGEDNQNTEVGRKVERETLFKICAPHTAL